MHATQDLCVFKQKLFLSRFYLYFYQFQYTDIFWLIKCLISECKLEMKHINRQQILNRRKQKRIQTQAATQKKPYIRQCVDRELRHVSDQTVDHLLKLAHQKRILTNEDKLDILHVIAAKTGVHLNQSTILEITSLLQCPHVKEISVNWEQSKKSYFVLKGSLLLYEQKPNHNTEKIISQTTLKTYKNLYDNEQSEYNSHEQFQKYHSDYVLVEDFQHFRGIGQLFKRSSQTTRRQKLIAINAILVCFEECKHNMQFIFHDGISDEGKMEILYQFPILKNFGKKIKNFIKHFNVKRYSLNEVIYKNGDHPNAVYFLIKGQVKFQFELFLKAETRALQSNRYETPFIVSTQVLGQSNYFGEEEILLKVKRNQTAKALTAKCVVLEFIAQKFEKLMENSDFSSLIIRAAMQKKEQRQYKIQKTKQLFEKQANGKQKSSGVFKEDVLNLPTEPLYLSKQSKSVHNHNNSHQKINWMHGHIVKKQSSLPVRKSSAPKQKSLSMIHINPDMYQATRKKYRKYTMKTLESQPERRWKEKNIWKVLKLQDVLREDSVVISAPEGRSFYDTSKRLQHHLNETHSIRPKTASSSYRTKLQYIAYLHRFNH